MLLTVYDLNRAQLDELKTQYVIDHTRAPSWADLANAPRIPDSAIIEQYAGYSFTPDDFLCSAGQ